MIDRLAFTDDETQSITALLQGLRKDFSSPESTDFLREAVVVAHELPLRIRRFLNNFRLQETGNADVCILSGYRVDEQKIGPTPSDRGIKADLPRTIEEQMLLVLISSLLGDPIGWATQQAGHIVHDISPVKGQECDQTGSSSKEELFFHTEDAFHPYRGDYLGMMCLRNENQAATMVASRNILTNLAEGVIDVLFQPRFVIRPDASQFEEHHFRKIDEISEEEFNKFLEYSKKRINKMNTEPEPKPILFGNKETPYICVDCFVYMDALDKEAEEAILSFNEILNAETHEINLQAGEICFIDNLRAVHGRKPFRYPARYDGRDRWMKRINVTRDLRKSSDLRMTSSSRIIF